MAIYDYETYPPPSSNGNGGLGFIGMQRCLDCPSSPIADLASRQAAQKWATVFSLNEPDINGISPAQAAAFHKQYINPLVIILFSSHVHEYHQGYLLIYLCRQLRKRFPL